NYRWPAQNEQWMNRALAIYARKDSAKLSNEERRRNNKEDDIIAKPFKDEFAKVKKVVQQIDHMTNGFQQLPPSEKKKAQMLELIRSYNSGMAKLKQYKPEEVDGEEVGFDYDEPDQLVEALGMTSEQEVSLTTVLSNELKQYMAKKKEVP